MTPSPPDLPFVALTPGEVTLRDWLIHRFENPRQPLPGDGFCQLGTDRPRRVAGGAGPPPEREIRAEVLRALLLADAKVFPAVGTSVLLEGAWISGALDLVACRGVRFLNLKACPLAERPDLTGVDMYGFVFEGVHLPGLTAPYAKFDTVIDLIQGCRVAGELRLFGSRIGGRLQLDGSTFLCDRVATGVRADDPYQSDTAIDASGLAVGQQVSMKPYLGPRGRWRRCRIWGEAAFRDARIGGNVLMVGVHAKAGRRWPADAPPAWGASAIDFSGASIAGELGGERDVPARIRGRLLLYGANAAALGDDVESWPKGATGLAGFTYQRVNVPVSRLRGRAGWLQTVQCPFDLGRLPNSDRGGFRPQPWRQLARVCRSVGQMDVARDTLIMATRMERAEVRAALRREGWSRRFAFLTLWDGLLDLTMRFGYRPERMVWPVLGFVVLGALIFAYADAHGLMSIKGRGNLADTSAPPFNALLFSMESFGPVGKFLQGNYWPEVRSWFDGGWWTRAYLVFHQLAGWVLAGIFAGGVAGLFKRDLE